MSTRNRLYAGLLSTVLGICAYSFWGARADAWTRVFINGQIVPVSFNDGDSFRVQAGEFQGSQCRLAGFNTLESFGPAHQWGDWHPYELYVNAKLALQNGRRGTWHCTADGNRDGYGRLLVYCPDLAVDQIRRGLATAYEVDDHPARPEYLRAQQEAIAAHRGMWAHGVPEFVMTSTHSADEDRTRPVHYDRLISTRDGHSESHEHNNVYRECEWVCNTERYANTDALRAAALALRADAQLAPRLTDYSNLLLEEFASRFVRNGVVPGYVPAELAPDLSARLLQMQSAGVLGTAATRIGACMLYGSFERHYGPNRAACLFGHGTQPPHRTSDTRGAH